MVFFSFQMRNLSILFRQARWCQQMSMYEVNWSQFRQNYRENQTGRTWLVVWYWVSCFAEIQRVFVLYLVNFTRRPDSSRTAAAPGAAWITAASGQSHSHAFPDLDSNMEKPPSNANAAKGIQDRWILFYLPYLALFRSCIISDFNFKFLTVSSILASKTLAIRVLIF